MNKKYIEHCADTLSSKYAAPPIPVDKIAKDNGINVIPYPFGGEIASTLVVKDGKPNLGYDPSFSKQRRFIIAHNIAHFILHGEVSYLFVDRKFAYYIDKVLTTNQRIEYEASYFALCLLMPRNLLKNQVVVTLLDYSDDDPLKVLAKTFDVSLTALAVRLAQIKI